MKMEKKVVKFLMDKGFNQSRVYFKDLALAVLIVKKNGTQLDRVYSKVAEETNQTLNTVTFHFHRAYKFSKEHLNEKASNPLEMISNLVKEYWYGKQENC